MGMILECFEYNQHFVAMMNIINHAKLFNKEGKFEKHHIIPKCFYKKKGLEIDNSSSNLVNLTLEEHKKVHQLAYLCAKEIVKSSLDYAQRMMNKRTLSGIKHSEETKEKISKAKKGKKGRPHPHKGGFQSDKKRRKMSEIVKSLYKDGKKNMSGENNPNYGIHFSWYNDGIRNYRVNENCLPLQNWKRGKI